MSSIFGISTQNLLKNGVEGKIDFKAPPNVKLKNMWTKMWKIVIFSVFLKKNLNNCCDISPYISKTVDKSTRFYFIFGISIKFPLKRDPTTYYLKKLKKITRWRDFGDDVTYNDVMRHPLRPCRTNIFVVFVVPIYQNIFWKGDLNFFVMLTTLVLCSNFPNYGSLILQKAPFFLSKNAQITPQFPINDSAGIL